jgi:hypothetical protein
MSGKAAIMDLSNPSSLIRKKQIMHSSQKLESKYCWFSSTHFKNLNKCGGFAAPLPEIQ